MSNSRRATALWALLALFNVIVGLWKLHYLGGGYLFTGIVLVFAGGLINDWIYYNEMHK